MKMKYTLNCFKLKSKGTRYFSTGSFGKKDPFIDLAGDKVHFVILANQTKFDSSVQQKHTLMSINNLQN